MDFLDSCRICRTHCTTSNSQYLTTSINDIEIREILTQTIPIDFNDEISQKLPQKICFACFETSMSAYELQQKAIESDEIFRAIVMSEQHTIEIKTEKLDKVEEIKVECDSLDFLDVDYFPSNASPPRKKTKTTKKSVKIEAPKSKESSAKFDRRHPKKAEIPYHPRKSKGYENAGYNSLMYDCNFCGEKFSSKCIFRHMQLHNPEFNPFACEICNKRFGFERKLKSHLKDYCTGIVEEIFTCDKCGVTGTSKIGMENHLLDDHLGLYERKQIKTVKIDREQKCEICNEEFVNHRSFDKHFMTVHERLIRPLNPDEVKSNLKCCKCEEIFENMEELQNHLKGYRNNFETVVCKICNVSTKHFDSFFKHSMVHAQPQTHKCVKCNENFAFGSKLLSHVRRHLHNGEAKMKCPECEQTYGTRNIFIDHFKIKHKNQTLYICPFCAKSCASKGTLEGHIYSVHNKDTAKKFPCKLCTLVFLSARSLRRHEVTHSTERPFACDICGSSFKSRARVTTHMRIHKLIVKKCVCFHCGKAFASKSKLDSHILTHTGLKPHQCEYCDRAYALKGDLTKHLRKVHLGDAIYKCEKCPKAFRTVVERREHYSEHKNDN